MCIMLMPKRVKYRRQHRGRMKGKAKGGTEVTFGDYGLIALETSWITRRQIEASRIAMTRYMKRGGRVGIKIFLVKLYTAKPQEVRMVSGKVALDGWVSVFKPGKLFYKLEGFNKEVAVEVFELVANKLLKK